MPQEQEQPREPAVLGPLEVALLGDEIAAHAMGISLGTGRPTEDPPEPPAMLKILARALSRSEERADILYGQNCELHAEVRNLRTEAAELRRAAQRAQDAAEGSTDGARIAWVITALMALAWGLVEAGRGFVWGGA